MGKRTTCVCKGYKERRKYTNTRLRKQRSERGLLEVLGDGKMHFSLLQNLKRPPPPPPPSLSQISSLPFKQSFLIPVQERERRRRRKGGGSRGPMGLILASPREENCQFSDSPPSLFSPLEFQAFLLFTLTSPFLL